MFEDEWSLYFFDKITNNGTIKINWLETSRHLTCPRTSNDQIINSETDLEKYVEFSFDYISEYFNLSMDIVNNSSYRWNYKKLSKNKSLRFDRENFKPSMDWDYDELSNHGNFPLELVMMYPTLEWNQELLFKRHKIALDFILHHLTFPWNFHIVSRCVDSLSWSDVLINDLPWQFASMTSNTLYFIRYYSQKP